MMNRCKRWRYSNNAFGYVLSSNVARVWNNAFRFNALGGATGSQNTAIGDYAGFAVITGSNINAIGAELSGVSSFFGEANTATYISAELRPPSSRNLVATRCKKHHRCVMFVAGRSDMKISSSRGSGVFRWWETCRPTGLGIGSIPSYQHFAPMALWECDASSHRRRCRDVSC